VCVVDLTKLRERISGLQTDLKISRAAEQRTASELAQTKTKLQGALSTLKETKGALEVSNRERDRAMAQGAAETRRSREVTQTLGKTKQELDEAKDHLARYTNTGLTPEQVVAASQRIHELQAKAETFEVENGLLTRKIRTLLEPRSPETSAPLPADLIAKVKITDPKWHFVVLDAGSEKGMLERGELLVSRNGKLLGKVRVSRVEKDRSFANLSPGWDIAELQEGDIAIPANPDSSGFASRN